MDDDEEFQRHIVATSIAVEEAIAGIQELDCDDPDKLLELLTGIQASWETCDNLKKRRIDKQQRDAIRAWKKRFRKRVVIPPVKP